MMKNSAIIAGVISLGLTTVALAESSYMPKYLENGLISICKSAAQDNLFNMNKTIKSFHLNHKVVSLKVVCNGQDIISFAERYGATRTTAKLSNSIGSVSVTDLASLDSNNYDVTFDFN